MPSRGSRSAAEEPKTYRSGPRAPRQKHFRALSRVIRQPVPSSGRARRQITLTQFDRGVPLDAATAASGDEFDEPRPRKRRKSRLPAKTESQNTLTQIGWLSTIPPSDSEEDERSLGEIEEGEKRVSEIPPSDDDEYDEYRAAESSQQDVGNTTTGSDSEFDGFSDDDAIVPEEESLREGARQQIEQEQNPVDEDVNMFESRNHALETHAPPEEPQQHTSPARARHELPRTPRRAHRLEIPSSQSPPVTPLSAIRTHERRNLRRSPLKPLSANDQAILDTPSKRRGNQSITSSSRTQSTKKVALFKKEPVSSPLVASPKSQGRSRIADSAEPSDAENETEDDDSGGEMAKFDIGQDTQAMIRHIDRICAAAERGSKSRASALDGAGEICNPPPESSANRSFDFDKNTDEDQETLDLDSPTRRSQPDGEPAAHDDSARVKEEPQSQWLWHPSQQPRHVSPIRERLPESPRQSQVSIVAGTTQDTHDTPRSAEGFQRRTVEADSECSERVPSSQPMQTQQQQTIAQSMHPSEETAASVTVDQTPKAPQHRVPDSPAHSSSVEQHPPSSSLHSSHPAKPPRRGNSRRNIEFNGSRIVTATQLLPSDGIVDYSLPPPPPWTQDTEDGE